MALAAYAAWNEGAFEDWKAMHHPDVVVMPPEGFPESEPSADREAWFTQAMRLTDSWEEQRIDIEDVEELSGGRVLATFCWITKGKDSGIRLDTPMACITTVRDGMIVRQEFFLDRGEARRAAGSQTRQE